MITLPFVSRKVHETFKAQYTQIFSQQAQRIEDLEACIKAQSDLIQLLSKQANAVESQQETSRLRGTRQPRQTTGAIVQGGRSGWRGRAQILSESTVPPPADSVAQLEAKVKKEGGIV